MKVNWSAKAERQRDRLDRTVRLKIDVALHRYATTGRGDTAALQGGLAGLHRLRVGDWRVIFTRGNPHGTLTVVAVENRRDAYR